MTMLRDFLAYYRPHRRLFVLDFSCAVVSGLLELGFPMVVSHVCRPSLGPVRTGLLILAASLALLLIYALNTGLMVVVNY